MSAVITAGGLSLPHVTNLIAGDGSGGASDSGVNAALTGADINPASIGATTPGTGAFTMLSANSEFRVYGTFTDANNYEYLQFSMGAQAKIWANAAGSGSPRPIWLSGDGIYLGGQGTGSTAWFINTTGHLTATTDNAYDIGDGAGHDPRNIYAKTSLTIGGGTPITNVLVGSAANGGASVPAGDYLDIPITVTGTTTTSRISWSFSDATCINGIVFAGIKVSADTVTFRFFNTDVVTPHNLGAANIYVTVINH